VTTALARALVPIHTASGIPIRTESRTEISTTIRVSIESSQ
jgi:hypothetical protein